MDVNEWALGQVGRTLGQGLVPVGMIAVGIWLLCVERTRVWRSKHEGQP